jgi:hypothetical protein
MVMLTEGVDALSRNQRHHLVFVVEAEFYQHLLLVSDDKTLTVVRIAWQPESVALALGSGDPLW